MNLLERPQGLRHAEKNCFPLTQSRFFSLATLPNSTMDKSPPGFCALLSLQNWAVQGFATLLTDVRILPTDGKPASFE